MLTLDKPADLVFNLRGSNLTDKKPLQPSMASNAGEAVWINRTGDANAPKVNEVKEKKDQIEWTIAGLGTPVKTIATNAKEGRPLDIKVALAHTAGKQVPPGKYAEKVFLVGHGIVSREVNLIVNRTLYEVEPAPPLKFTLFGTGGSASKTIKPKLVKADDDAKEMVWLSRTRDASEPDKIKETKTLKLTSKKGKTLDVEAEGFDQEAALQGEVAGELSLKLTLPRDRVIPVDDYEAEVFVVGKGVNRLPIKIVVERRLFDLKLGLKPADEMRLSVRGENPARTRRSRSHSNRCRGSLRRRNRCG